MLQSVTCPGKYLVVNRGRFQTSHHCGCLCADCLHACCRLLTLQDFARVNLIRDHVEVVEPDWLWLLIDIEVCSAARFHCSPIALVQALKHLRVVAVVAKSRLTPRTLQSSVQAVVLTLEHGVLPCKDWVRILVYSEPLSLSFHRVLVVKLGRDPPTFQGNRRYFTLARKRKSGCV